MPHHPRRRARPVSLLAVAALAIGIFLVFAAVASAHVRPSLESTVGEEAATAPLQENTTETPAENPTSEASGESSREQRHKRHQERRETRQRRWAGHELAAATGCTVTLDATPSLVTAEDPLSLSGTLSCPEGSSAAGQTVTLFQMLARSGSSYEAATTTTEADGTYKFTPTSLAVNSGFYVSAAGAQSQTTRVKVSPHVTIATPLDGTQLLVGSGRATRAAAPSDSANAVTFTGMVTPANVGTRVALQRETRDGAWARIGGGEVNAQGEYSILHTFYRPGRANIRVIVHDHGLTLTAVSAPVTYQIARRHNRQITIQPSAEPPAGEVPPAA
ncbi:MAG TPA: hypothetical protein VK680_06415 [Solirubrobacteraceae bacterium]|jgi:hypothetical protein|nr:hypothetical protein [Solirubrobacteraceae bacterium]